VKRRFLKTAFFLRVGVSNKDIMTKRQTNTVVSVFFSPKNKEKAFYLSNKKRMKVRGNDAAAF